ncbi:ATP-dependent zinc metalloprotease FtsH [Desulfovibrio sp. JC010]|uniref:ATP-dependent zinc metalloprotease FtsH n=1 Tax=Desulfovibrio sp. JC010 TaxID=2593641 RepID=UPI0013D7D561|nr:ATP-dependent zinc metalloprotease FtsH [Desulfovibrio sp. JC010]NDV27258.1 ATP-dependent metallopeptidase FtsH/Yme1/Tma family protein [Desulfovibrio sp. JC010]
MNSFAKNLLVWVTIMLVMIVLFNLFNQPQTSQLKLSYTDFLSRVDEGEVLQVKIQGQKISGVMVGDKRFVTYNPDDPALVQHLLKNKIEVVAEPEEEAPWYMTLFISWFPMLLLVGVWIFFMRQMQGGGGGRGGAMSFGRSKARMINEETARVTFEDVAGVDEAKDELAEVVQFLSEPKKFTRLGGRIPKGVLLVGPPGTGKTLLARAVAGEAGVPFFSISGSDFVEMFVGVGASRVRDLFAQGKKNAPCLIFIDEIDAVGRQRGAGLGGGHDEREQTLNQLLVEMDGFESNEGVILIAATNRPDVLDPALLRPGRFDRQVVVPTPDVQGRAHILKVHTRKTPLAGEIDLDVIARGTPGFSGADLENLVNEAALYAAKNNQDYVKMADFEEAKDKVLMGRERRSLILTDEEKKTTAYHEAGHALIAKLLENCDPVHKVTIIPRGRALGVTQQLPVDDRHNYNKEYLKDTLVMLLGGRVAEELILDQVTTGASNDIERATKMARSMVCQWGMSEKLGPMTFGESQDQVFLGKELVQHKDFSEDTSRLIDSEVRRIIDTAYETANKLLSENEKALHAVSEALLERETIDGNDLDTLMAGGTLPPLESVAPSNAATASRAYGSTSKAGYTPVAESEKEDDADKGEFAFEEQPSEQTEDKPEAKTEVKEEFKLSEESAETEEKEDKKSSE